MGANFSTKKRVKPVGRDLNTECRVTDIDPTKESDLIETRNYVYPFENLAFEGGGSKGLAYCGVVKEMEEMGMTDQVKRVAGTSAGAMTATLLCLGYSADDIRGFITHHVPIHAYDHGCGYCSLLPNLIRSFGWNPGRKLHRWFGDCMYEKTQNRDATFRDVYEMFGKELCVVVTNLSRMSTVYCHVKTTPDMPVALAVRMSLSLPGIYAAQKMAHSGGTDIYVDGGLLCNYPIHCFDGWWLSMDSTDSFFNKLQPVSQIVELMENRNRFATWNEKTLGFLLYSDDEPEIYRANLDSRPGSELPDFPQTKLAKQYAEKSRRRKQEEHQSQHFMDALVAFFKVLRDNDIDQNSTISLRELQLAFNNKSFTIEHRRLLFGQDVTAEEAFCLIQTNKSHKMECARGRRPKATQREIRERAMSLQINEEIHFLQIMAFFESNSMNQIERITDINRYEVTNLASFARATVECMQTNLKKMYMTFKDVERTVGINTGYLGTLEVDWEERDRQFLVEQGRRAFVSFLKYYVKTYSPPLKPHPAAAQRMMKGT